GARRVAPRAQMPHAQMLTGRGKAFRAVTRAVIHHHRGDAHAQAAQAAHCAAQETHRGATALVGQYFAQREARAVLDGHMREFPPRADATVATPPGPPWDSPASHTLPAARGPPASENDRQGISECRFRVISIVYRMRATTMCLAWIETVTLLAIGAA